MSSDPFGFAPGETDGKDVAIRVRGVSKHYAMFNRPEDRFKQMVIPRLQRLISRKPRRYFIDFAALNDVSFEVGRGETVGIIGRNGSGKSTLLQIICGTLQPTSGSVEINGRIAALLELGAGFNPEFTGRENVFLNASILGVPRQEMEWRYDDIARFADIGAFINQPVKTYSSGMYVRLAFAVAINVDPDILIVDEALSVGDEAFQRKCFARMEDIRDKGGTILFVSHGAQTIVQLCNRAILMDRGENILEGRPKTVVGQYQRLIHASEEKAFTIRQEIVGRNWESAVEETGCDDEAKTKAPVAQSVEDFFDPNLVSHSRVEYDIDGGLIEDLHITRLDGSRVNVLARNVVYLLRYRARFHEPFDKVGFASYMKNVNGLELGVQTSHDIGEGHSVAAGDVYEICFPFRTAVTPATYFFNAGIYTSGSGEFRQIHRLIDGIACRVMPDKPSRVRMGLVDLVPEGEYGPIVRRVGDAVLLDAS